MLEKFLKIVTYQKMIAVHYQDFELAAALREIERSYYRGSFSDVLGLILCIQNMNSNKIHNVLAEIERKVKLDDINVILIPLIRKDKIKNIKKIYG